MGMLMPAERKPAHRLENGLFLALLAAYLFPVWSFRYFPSQDGPAHLENAAILCDYHDPNRPLLRTFYHLNVYPEPNWFSHLFLAGLLHVASPLVAEKVLLTVYWTLLPMAVRYAARSVRPEAGYLAVFAFPFADNLFLHMGFYNFCFSLAFYFLVVGYWLRHRDDFNIPQLIVLTVLVLILYFCHLVGVAAAGLTIGVCILGHRFRARSLIPLVAFIPVIALGAWFLWRQAGASHKGIDDVGFIARFRGLLQLEALVSYNSLEGLVSTVLGAGLWLVMVAQLFSRIVGRRWQAGDEFLLCAVLFAVAYFLAPDEAAGGSFLYMRLGLFPYFALILWLAAQPVGPRVRWSLQLGAAGSSILLLALHVASYRQLNGLLDEYHWVAEMIEPETTLVSISFDHTGHSDDGQSLSKRVGAFRHAAGYFATERGTINLLNYEAGTGYFPVRFNADVSPFEFLGGDPKSYGGGLLDQPPRVDLAGYSHRTGQTVD